MATKLTLSVDPKVVEAAKRYAAATGTSVSGLVEAYLAAITKPPQPGVETPMLVRWRGSMSAVDIDDYREHLMTKYT